MKLGEDGLNKFFVARFGRADKIVIRQFQFFCERLPIRREFIAINLRRFAFGLRGLLDFLAVFVQTGQKKTS